MSRSLNKLYNDFVTKKIRHNEWFYIFLLIGVTLVFYWKVILKGFIPFPGDLLVGAYFPWLDYKWGWVVGVPIKNPLLSDVFSQFFIWKSLIAESFKALQWPLWNPYMYSGYPLLANFHSGALNPFNSLMAIFGDIPGWKLMIISQSVGAVLAMYLFLKSLRLSSQASGLGALVYTFSSFAITWSQFVTLGFAMIWLPLILLCINKYFEKKNNLYLLLFVPLIFLLMSSGHFQAFIFSILLINAYFVFKLFGTNKKEFIVTLLKFLAIEVLSAGVMCIQLLPTYQQMNASIRFNETYIVEYNYGLLPIKHIATLLSPNFFGSPVTGNYWGFFNYHETTIYIGVIGLFALAWAIINFKQLSGISRFFLFSCLVALVLIFANPISEWIYKMQIPLISTSAAGRMVFIYIFSGAVLVSTWADFILKINFCVFLKKHWPIIALAGIQLIATYIFKIWFSTDLGVQHLKISIRNMIPSLGLVLGIIAIFYIFSKKKVLLPLLCLLTIADLFYFGWKYTSVVPTSYVYPQTEVLTYLKNNIEFGRIESEKNFILPANTWVYYRLPGISGYDPLALKDYVSFYQTNINNQGTSSLSRYSTLASNYNADLFGKLSVKYLLALKYSDKMEIIKTGNNLYWNIDLEDWNGVYDYGSIVVLQNTKYRDRARLEDSNGNVVGQIKIVKYTPNEVVINYSTPKNARLILVDTLTPDWKAELNSKKVTVNKYMDTFRTIDVSEGMGTVRFYYHPTSFYIGLTISAIASGVWLLILILTIVFRKKNINNKQKASFPNR